MGGRWLCTWEVARRTCQGPGPKPRAATAPRRGVRGSPLRWRFNDGDDDDEGGNSNKRPALSTRRAGRGKRERCAGRPAPRPSAGAAVLATPWDAAFRLLVCGSAMPARVPIRSPVENKPPFTQFSGWAENTGRAGFRGEMRWHRGTQ